MDDGWIVIPHWDEFQHRDATRTRSQPWIKNYTRLLHDDAYLNLTGHQRAVLHGLWLLYASSHCQLAANTASLTRQLALRVSTHTLESLSDAGLLTFSAGKPASLEQNREEKRLKAVQSVASYEGAAAAAKKQRRAKNPELSADLVDKVTALRGADKNTRAVLATFAGLLPEAAFRNALEATTQAAANGRMRGSQIAYFIGALNRMASEGQYT